MKTQDLLRYKWLVLGGYFLLLVVGLFGASSLGVDPNNRVFFAPGHEQFEALLRFEDEFGSNTNLLIAINSSTGTLNTDKDLVRAISWLSDEAWRVHGVTRVDSAATYPFGRYSEDELVLSTLIDEFCPTVCDLESTVEFLKPHLKNRYVSADLKTASVVVSVDIDESDSEVVSRIDREARSLLGDFKSQFPDLAVYMTGAVPMMQAFVDASNQDLGSLVLAAVILFVLLLWVFLRSAFLTLALVGIGVSSIVITLGLAGLMGHTINTATATSPLVIFTLVVAGSMHVFLHIARDPCANAAEVRLVVDRSYSANTTPILIAAATSVVGLLSLAFVSAPPIKQLGMLAALGVVVGTAILLLVVPIFLSRLSVVRPAPVLLLIQRALNRKAKKIETGDDRYGFVLATFLIASACVFFLRIDEDFVRYFGADNIFRVDSEFVTSSLAGPYHAEIVLDTKETGGIYDPETIETVSELVAEIRRHPDVANVLSVLDVLSEVSRSLSGTESIESVGEEALAQYFLSFELALAKGQSTTDFVDVDHSKVRVSVLLGDVSMADIRGFERHIENWWEGRSNEAIELTITGEGLPTAHLSSGSIRELALGIFLSLTFSSCLLGFLYRNGRVALVVLLATTIPVLSGFGLWGVFVGEIGMAATLVVAVTIGVVIDDVIHLLYRFRDGRAELDLSPREAAGYSIHRTAAALVTTSVVLAGGFSILMLSEFRMNSAFGICSALVIVLALVYNTSLTPRALVWASQK